MAANERLEAAIRARFEAGAHGEAATLLLEGYGREVLGFLLTRLRDPEIAGEVFSSFTEDLWSTFPTFGFRCSARVWAYTLARHAASRHLKMLGRNRRRHVPLSEAPGLSALELRIRTETAAILKSRVKERVEELRGQLSPEDRSLLFLRINRELGWREIAHVLGYEGDALDEAVLVREAARLRKRFQLVKQRLRQWAADGGLVEIESDKD